MLLVFFYENGIENFSRIRENIKTNFFIAATILLLLQVDFVIILLDKGRFIYFSGKFKERRKRARCRETETADIIERRRPLTSPFVPLWLLRITPDLRSGWWCEVHYKKMTVQQWHSPTILVPFSCNFNCDLVCAIFTTEISKNGDKIMTSSKGRSRRRDERGQQTNNKSEF